LLHTTSITFTFKPKHFSYKRSFCFFIVFTLIRFCCAQVRIKLLVPTITWGDNRWFLCADTHVLGAKHHAISKQKTQPNCWTTGSTCCVLWPKALLVAKKNTRKGTQGRVQVRNKEQVKQARGSSHCKIV
jgi:hypothetical protein